MPATRIRGFNLGYAKAKPGKGPLMHNHDTNEPLCMTGRWRCEWNEGPAIEYVDLEPLERDLVRVGVGAALHDVTYDASLRRNIS